MQVTSDIQDERLDVSQSGSKALTGAFVQYGLALLFALALCYAYDVQSRWWSYFGFTYMLADDTLRYAACFAAAAPAMLLNPRPRTFAQAAAWFLYALVFLPCLLVPVMQFSTGLDRLIAVFSATFVSCVAFLLLVRGDVRQITLPTVPPRFFWTVLLGAWLGMMLLVLISFGGSFQFSGADNLYDQRFASTGIVANPAVRYSLALLSSGIDPFIIGAGLYTRRYWLVAIGVLSQIILFGTIAAKAALLSPLFVTGAFFLFDRKSEMRGNLLLIGLLGVFILTVPLLTNYNPLGGGLNQLVTLIYFRTFLIAGMTYGVYEQFFSINSLTYFSNNHFVSLFISYPYADLSVGQAVQQFLFPIVSTDIGELNASFLATDGMAAFGLVGVPLAGAATAIALKILSRFVPPERTRLMLASGTGFILSLANTSLFTSLISGCGILLVILVSVAPLERK